MKRPNREVVEREQDFDYSYPFLYGRTKDSCQSTVKGVTLMHDEFENENFLLNIGNIF